LKLLAAGFKLDDHGLGGLPSIVSLAVSSGQLSVLKLLVAHYGDSLITTQFVENSEAGCQMLEAAVGLGHTDIVRFLLEKGIPRNMRLTSCAQSLLSLAAGWGHLDLVRCLVTDVQANIDSRDVQNRDPLWWAAYHGYLDVVQYLVEAGSDINVVCSDTGWTSLYAAAAKNCEEVV
jgi:ankyrin repeat protein